MDYNARNDEIRDNGYVEIRKLSHSTPPIPDNALIRGVGR
jgi:hypothetical protein